MADSSVGAQDATASGDPATAAQDPNSRDLSTREHGTHDPGAQNPSAPNPSAQNPGTQKPGFRGSRAAGATVSGPESGPFGLPPRGDRPRVVVRADLLPVVSVLSAAGLLGIPLAWLWSLLAPAQRVRVIAATGEPPALPLESWHRFDGLVIFGLLGIGAGIVIGTVTWMLRERRGPVVLIAAVAGAALAGWLGLQLGPTFGNSRYPVTGTPALGEVLSKAPVLESSWVLIAPAFATALVYGLLAAWNGRDDLGRRLG